MKQASHIKIAFILFTLLVAFASPPVAASDGIITGDTIPAGTVLKQGVTHHSIKEISAHLPEANLEKAST